MRGARLPGGSGWKDYRATGAVCGIAAPSGAPGVGPAARAALHARHQGRDRPRREHPVRGAWASAWATSGAEEARAASLALYARARAHAEARGIILADTKFEFGLRDGRLVWIDEALTPDSSRFWPRDGYAPGSSPPSFDKQYVRDYLETLALGQAAARVRRSRRTWSRARAEKYAKRSRA